jgi:hypothetical protein
MVEPAAGGPLGAVGLPLPPSPSLLHPVATETAPTTTPIRRIGELRRLRKILHPDTHMCSAPFIRMAHSSGDRALYLVTLLRQIATTASATVIGVFNVATRRPEVPIELKPGDPAPDFSLPGSDGRTHRLKELAGRPVVIAWFPKAFTGG